MNVLLLSRYSWAGNTSRLRSYQYLPLLQSEGIEVTAAPLTDDAYVEALYSGQGKNWAALLKAYLARIRVLRGSKRFDLVWVERELFPMVPAIAEMILNTLGVRYVVDYDDAIFHNYDMNRNPLVRSLLGRKIDRVMRHATMVIVGNPYLAERARKAGARRIEQLPTVVDLDQFPLGPDPDNAIFTVGWIGIPLNARYLVPIRDALAELTRDGTSRVVLVGSREFELPGVPLEIVPWVEERAAAEIRKFDVGIMPLPDTAFERGKCGFKILQYFASGRCAVVSPVGVNRSIIDDGINGFLAETPEEWARALRTLRDDPALRRRMGQAGRRKVEQHYALRETAPRLAALLRKAAGRV